MNEVSAHSCLRIAANIESSIQRENLFLYYQPVNGIKSNFNSVFYVIFYMQQQLSWRPKKSHNIKDFKRRGVMEDYSHRRKYRIIHLAQNKNCNKYYDKVLKQSSYAINFLPKPIYLGNDTLATFERLTDLFRWECTLTGEVLSSEALRRRISNSANIYRR